MNKILKTGNSATFIKKYLDNSFSQNLGVYSAKGTPVPISNTEVKLRNVDGTAWLHVGE